MLGRLVAAEAIVVGTVGCIVGTAMGWQLSWVAANMRNRVFGLGYEVRLPLDITIYGWAAVLSATLIAAIPAIRKLVRAEPRELLAGDRIG